MNPISYQASDHFSIEELTYEKERLIKQVKETEKKCLNTNTLLEQVHNQTRSSI